MAEKINLLMVDNEEQFISSMAKRLEVRDFRVLTAACGEDAIEAAGKCPIDVALLDLRSQLM